MIDLNSIRDNIIKQGFPELSGITIDANFKGMDDAYMGFCKVDQNHYQIYTDTSLKNAPVGVVTGVMAHEISHIARDSRLGLMEDIDNLLYILFPMYAARDERRTDLLVVERGFGRELLEFLKYADKRREEYNEKRLDSKRT